MKIGFFVESGLGVGALLCDQIISISDYNPEIIAFASAKEQEPGLLKRIEDAGISTHVFEGMDAHKSFLRHVRCLRNIIINKQLDIIHVQTNWELILSWVSTFGIRNRPRIVYTIHAFRNNKSYIKKTIARIIITFLLGLFSDKVIVTCKYMRNQFSLLYKKMYLVPLGIDEKYINREYVSPPNELVMLFPATFRQGKRQDLLIRAFAKYINISGDTNARLILPGKGELFEFCENLAKASGIQEYVSFPGFCSKKEMLTYYDQSNILLCSSISETYSQAIVEGLSLGKCIITTPVGVALDIIDNKSTGFFFSNEDELVERLLKLHKNITDIGRICYHNYLLKDNYSWKSISKRYLEYLSMMRSN